MWNMKCSVIPVVIEATAEKISRRNTRQAHHRFTAMNSDPGNIAHTKESATVRSLKPECEMHHWFKERNTGKTLC
jgi:hypothetical protein